MGWSGKNSFIIEEDIRQEKMRMYFIIFFTTTLIYFNYFLNINIPTLNIIFISYSILTIAHFIFLKSLPDKFVSLRRYLMTTIDIVTLTLIINYLGYYGFVFNLFYLWIILGSLIRFGIKYFIHSIITILISIMLLYIYSPYWHNYSDLILYMIISVIMVSMFVEILIYRLKKENIELGKLLELVELKSKMDSLTMIPNRLSFEIEIKKYMTKGVDFALLFIDIDGFKGVNDNYGHDIGDKVLREIADRLNRSIGENDFLARLGGDEFVVISLRDRKDVLRIAHKICINLSRPYIDGMIDNLSASIGISYFPKDTTDEFMLKRYADIAMYVVKENGKSGYVEYRSEWKESKPINLQAKVEVNHCR